MFKGLGAIGLAGIGSYYLWSAYRVVPGLMAQLQYPRPPASLTERASKVADWSWITATVAGPLVLSLLGAAFTHAPPSQRHPYLVYASVCSGVALAFYLYTNWATVWSACSRLRCIAMRSVCALHSSAGMGEMCPFSQTSQTWNATGASEEYVHVKGHGSSTSNLLSQLTPESSAVPSPVPVLVVDEAEEALRRKEWVSQLKRIRGSSIVSGAATMVSLALVVVGIWGECLSWR